MFTSSKTMSSLIEETSDALNTFSTALESWRWMSRTRPHCDACGVPQLYQLQICEAFRKQGHMYLNECYYSTHNF
jgi:hypothetical protein